MCFQVELTVTPLPELNEDDKLWCHFGEMSHQAELQGEAIICQPPNKIPPTPEGQGKEITMPQTQKVPILSKA